jgi:hypothetical protein
MDLYGLRRSWVLLGRRVRPNRLVSWFWPFFNEQRTQERNVSFFLRTSLYLLLAVLFDHPFGVFPLTAAIIGVLGTIWLWLRHESKLFQVEESAPAIAGKRPDYRLDFLIAAVALFLIVPLTLNTLMPFGADFTASEAPASLTSLVIFAVERLITAVDIFDSHDVYGWSLASLYAAFGVERAIPNSSLAQAASIGLSVLYNALLISGFVLLWRSLQASQKVWRSLERTHEVAVRFGDARMRGMLSRALTGVDERRVRNAAIAVQKLRDRRHIPQLLKGINKAFSPDACTACLDTLVALDPDGARTHLRDIARKHRFVHLRITAIRLLADYPVVAPADRDAVLPALNETSPILRRAAAKYLSRLDAAQLGAAATRAILARRKTEAYDVVKEQLARAKLQPAIPS